MLKSLKKGALSLDYAVQIVIILVVITAVIGAVIQTVPQDSSDIGGQETARRGQIETECENQCIDIKLASSQDAQRDAIVDYCTSKFISDINDDNQFGAEGAGYNTYCEDGIRCFHMHDCEVEGQRLGPVTCVEKLCDYYEKDEGLSTPEASEQLNRIFLEEDEEGIYGKGTCELEDTRTENWYNELQEMSSAGGLCEN